MRTSASPVLLWFRRDLRLCDNPALDAAIADGRPVIPFYVLDDADAGDWAPGGASRWWLHESLVALGSTIRGRGNRLILRTGPAEAAIEKLLTETGAASVYWNRRYEPWSTRRDEQIKSALKLNGIDCRSFSATLLREPWTVKTQKGEPYRVFTPFWKALRALGDPDRPGSAPSHIPAPKEFPETDDLSSWVLQPSAPDWASGIRATWSPGELGGQERLEAFIDTAVFNYREERNLPGVHGTSRLSPHLHFGEIGPRQVWDAVVTASLAKTGSPMPHGAETYLSEIAWREFSYHLLFHFPKLPDQPLRSEFSDFPWSENAEGLAAWQHGLTG